VARLSSEKDFPTLLRATALVVREVPEFRLLLVGDGAERNRLEQLVRELDLADHVQLLGERCDIPELLAQSAFFVSSSLTEGVSLTLLEAMAVGLPVLATNVGGNPEVVADGETGRLVAAADPAALAAGIVRMCRERGKRPTMGRCGRRRVEEYFDVRTMMQQYEHLYDELLEAAGK
jgi:glycosyltransferase involved in cell wall biosynthesis